MTGTDAGGREAGSWVTATYGPRVRDVLVDLVEFTDMAARLVAKGRSSYDQDETSRLAAEAISHRIGEAVARLPDAFMVDHPTIEWRKIRGMRNIIAHSYARVDYSILWNALDQRMPEVKAYVRDLLAR